LLILNGSRLKKHVKVHEKNLKNLKTKEILKMKRNQKGITLVALVVTIIVLLILAGISLNLVAGSNGILTRASNAANTNYRAAAREATELKIAETLTAYYEAKYVTRPAYTGTVTDYLTTNAGSFTTGDGDYSVTVATGESGVVITNATGKNKLKTNITGTLDATGKITWDN